MQPFDDIAALSERAQALLGIRGQNPACGPGGLGQAQPLKRPHPTHPQLPQRVTRGVTVRPEINHPFRPTRFPGKRAIELCPAFCCHLRFKTTTDL
ncbi:MAG: hypothetical protein E6575_23015, partial [Bradyrhizobium sp.]|nr:hypothetical protein [Bradyrhizobium sp.]